MTPYSFWFLPTLSVVVAVVLAVTLIEVHGWLPSGALDRWPQVFGAGAEGTRGLLATVASSMITVAGVVFSITLVALSLASSQYTSRMLRNLMSDRVTQFVLGAFVGIFAYCLVVLRTIRGGDEGVFVPSVGRCGGAQWRPPRRRREMAIGFDAAKLGDFDPRDTPCRDAD